MSSVCLSLLHTICSADPITLGGIEKSRTVPYQVPLAIRKSRLERGQSVLGVLAYAYSSTQYLRIPKHYPTVRWRLSCVTFHNLVHPSVQSAAALRADLSKQLWIEPSSTPNSVLLGDSDRPFGLPCRYKTVIGRIASLLCHPTST
jgi:hypothetical protein